MTIHDSHNVRSSDSSHFDLICETCNATDAMRGVLDAPCQLQDYKHPTPHPKDPKKGAGDRKVQFHTLPFAVIAEDAVAHSEGALKYGAHNWQNGEVIGSTYISAAFRHLFAYLGGEDIDPDSGLHHLTKLRATIGVLRDAQIHGTAIDDRAGSFPPGFLDALNQSTVEMSQRVVAAGLAVKKED
ncbi:dATP/dGTP diphosphohydrolase domain-containing protein [Roseobacter litoralis]|uniref:dATP/dGTP diphosphohydrolase domain-containing protein n=1 Tax=Roseobacter litoralis TaxID=42443 RepID=UPI002493FA15|nr:dATP/dGTP diphosphohydrolase domain-containing protein [Roseobacter litoralis]